MLTIYKYQLPAPGGIRSYSMPSSFQVSHCGLQNDIPFMWVMLDTEHPHTQAIKIETVGTGHLISRKEGEPLGTWFQGPFVWHAVLLHD